MTDFEQQLRSWWAKLTAWLRGGPGSDGARKAKAAMQDFRDSDLREGETGRKAREAVRDLRDSDAGRKAREALQDLRDSEAGRKAMAAFRDLRDSGATRDT